MADAAVPPPVPPVGTTTTVVVSKPGDPSIRVVSHSGLFYWWPIWFLGFVFALWTFSDGYRMAIVPSNAQLVSDKASTITMTGTYPRMEETSPHEKEKDTHYLKTRVTALPWMGPIFLIVLFLVILITNVPLRGLWSLVTIITILLMTVIFSLLQWWDTILGKFADLHVYINMAGYLFIATLLLAAWLFTVFVFDKRQYIIFTPGQIKVCEEVGGRERVFDTTGMTVEKQRDDWFRHIILGFGSGDLTVKTAGADRQTVVMPNVAFIGFKIGAIERLLRERQIK